MDNNNKKYYAVMILTTEISEGLINAKPNHWVNIKNYYYTDGTVALGRFLSLSNFYDMVIDQKIELIGPCNTEDELNNEMAMKEAQYNEAV